MRKILRCPVTTAFYRKNHPYGTDAPVLFYLGRLHADGALNGIYGVEQLNTMLVGIHALASGVVGSALSDHIGADIFAIAVLVVMWLFECGNLTI